ncbi:hypothetical protein OH492_12720 [Vibrio chagasii]|nr:hypothetical protein [Vibrio chagasii]
MAEFTAQRHYHHYFCDDPGDYRDYVVDVIGKVRPLYSKSANFDSSQVLHMLDEESIRYQLSQDDGQILVPEGDVLKIRMILASKTKNNCQSGLIHWMAQEPW